MPRSSRSKSHKHSSKEVKEYSDSEVDLKVKERSDKEDVSIKVSKDLLFGEKRKFNSQSKDGKDVLGNGNCDFIDEHVVSKRRKEKVEGRGSERWNGGGGERSDGLVVVKEAKVESLKGKEMKGSVDLKSKSRRHDGGSEIKGDNEEESKSSSRIESERKRENDSSKKEYREVKEKDGRGVDKGKKGEDGKDGEVVKKQRSHCVDIGEGSKGKRSRENTDEVLNPQLEKELEKRARRREDGSSDKDKHQDDMRNSNDKRSSRGVCSRDVSHRDKYEEDDDKYIRRREAKYRKDGEKDGRYRDEKHHEDSCGDNRRRDDIYHENGDKNNRRKEDQYLEQGDENDRHNGGKYRENDKSIKHKEEKHCEYVCRGNRHSDSKQKIDTDKDRDKRAKDVKYKNDNTSRDNGVEPEMTHTRGESNAAEINHRKSRKRDLSPIYNDRVTRYKEDKGSRRINDKETCSDFRSVSTSKRHTDLDKSSISNCKIDKVTEKGWSNSHNTDVDTTPNHSLRKGYPSSNTHAAREHDSHVCVHCRTVSNDEESKNREYGYEERVQHNVSSSRDFASAGPTEKRSSANSREKYTQKDDGRLSAERCVGPDSRASPLRKVDKSPSSTSTERRHLNRSEIRRTLDTEEFAQRKGSSRDYSGREGKGSWELQKEMHSVDKHSHADGDIFSVSSPFGRNSNFSGNLRTRPPPPFRNGLDYPSAFGYTEDNSRGRSNSRQRRNSDSNMVRSHGNTWKGVPNWPSPAPNGFIPFQHGPPPGAFHPVMHQFPAPPTFAVRHTMGLNNTIPFHMPDTARFSSHERGWRNPVDESCPPWDENNAVYSANTHGYGRLDRDQHRNQMSSRGWDTSADILKGQNNGLSGDLPSTFREEDLDCPTADEVSPGQAGHQAQNVLNQPNSQEDSLEVWSTDPLNDIIPETPKSAPEESRETLEMSVKDVAGRDHIYLSKLDISTYLTQPDLYDQLTSLICMDQNTLVDEDTSKIIYVEEVLYSKLSGDEIWSGTLFAATNDSVFQNAMSLYKKQREEIRPINKDGVLSSNMEILEVIQTSDNEKVPSDDNKPEKGVLASCDNTQDVKSAAPDESVDMSRGEQEAATASRKLNELCPTDIVVVSEDQAYVLNEMEVEVDPVPRVQVEDIIMVDESPLVDAELSEVLLPGNFEETKLSDRFGDDLSAANIEDNELINTKQSPMLYSDMSSGVCEAGMPESIESESVILSRIHHSPESTH